MAGLFGHLAAGAATSVGDSIVEQARFNREAALRKLERQEDKDFERETRQSNQDFSAQQNQLNREASADLVTMEDGTAGSRIGSKVQPITNAAGDPVKLAGDRKNDPATVAEAEYLLRNGVVDTVEEAYEKAKSGKPSPMTLKDIDELAMRATELEIENSYDRDPETFRATLERNRKELMRRHGLAEDTRPDDAGISRPSGATDEQLVEAAKDAIRKGADKTAVASRLRRLGIDPKDAGL